MQRYSNTHRRHPRWPHFDERGPEHYYDDNPWDGRGTGWSGVYHGARREPAYRNDSDIYEDEFVDQEPFWRRYHDDHGGHWPEDDFYRQREQLFADRPEDYTERHPPLSWRRFRSSRRNYRPPFPEDRHDHGYGRNIHDRNANRGRPSYREAYFHDRRR